MAMSVIPDNPQGEDLGESSVQDVWRRQILWAISATLSVMWKPTPNDQFRKGLWKNEGQLVQNTAFCEGLSINMR